MKIVNQGSIIVNDVNVVYQNDRVACLEIDLHSKYAGMTTGVSSYKGKGIIPNLHFYVEESTLHLHEDYPRDTMTQVEFPEYEGWDIFACQGPYRYAVRLTLFKWENRNE